MKKVLIGLGVVVGIIMIAAIAFFVRFKQMTATVEGVEVENIAVETIEDGVYTGSFGDFLVFVEAKVTVAGGRITAIDIVDQRCGKGYEGLETVDRIIAAQSPKVDAVSGATGSSKSIMIAVQDALSDAPRRPPLPDTTDTADTADTAEADTATGASE